MNIIRSIAIKLRGANSFLYKLRKNQLFINKILPLFNFHIPIKLYFVNHKVWINLAKHQSWLLTSGILTPELSSLFLAINQVYSPKIFYDIGANIGFYSWLLLTENKDIKTVLFEPDPDNLNLLNKTIKTGNLENRVNLIAKGVSNQTGVAKFAVDKITSATGTLLISKPTFIETQYEAKSDLITINTVTLDDFYQENNSEGMVEFIKIDVEGFEKEVFDGGEGFITQNKSIIIFECSSNNKKELIYRLHNWGYQVFNADVLNGSIENAYNILAIPPQYLSSLDKLFETWSLELKKWR